MLTSSNSNLSQSPLKLKKDENKVFSKKLTSNVSMAKLSKEDNYCYEEGAFVAIPFMWESQPGTPKIKFRENPLPPLTPPPSYFYNTPKRPPKKHSKSSLLDTIFTKRGSRRMSFPISSSSSSSPSSSTNSSLRLSSYSAPSSPMMTVSRSRGRYGMSMPRQSFSISRMVNEEEDEYELPGSSTSCFGRSRGCYASMIKVLRN